MITFKYKDINSNELVEQTLDNTQINVPEYLKNFHKNYLCKDVCNGENCKIWIKVGDEFILAGIED